jgi:oxygen-dependent protoporphyrinogen oxidase
MVGGDGNRESTFLKDDDIVRVVCTELDDILGIIGEPEIVRIYRLERGIPQFAVGHSDRVKRIELELAKLDGVFLTGNAYYGVGLNDCIKQSFRVAESI